MKIREFMTESFQTVSINGILYSLNTDEKTIYKKVKEAGKLLKSDLSEFDARIANGMVTKGLLKRRKNPQHEIYFVAKGRRKCALNKPIEEVAPPDHQIEKWIEDNKERFQEKYGKEYKKYLYGKAWNKFNGKKMVNESITYEIDAYDIMYDIDIPTAYNFEVTLDEDNREVLISEIESRIESLSGYSINSFNYEINDTWTDEDEDEEETEPDIPADYWDGDDEEQLNETVYQAKYKKGQKLINYSSGDEYTIKSIDFERGYGFFYVIGKKIGEDDNGLDMVMSFRVSEKDLDEKYIDSSIDDEEWDGEDDEELNESSGSKDELEFYKKFEGTEVTFKRDDEEYTIVSVEHDGFDMRFTLESNESNNVLIVSLDELKKYFTNFIPFQEDDEYWDGEDE